MIKKQCNVCTNFHVETLFSGTDGVCVYCKADRTESLPAPAPIQAEEKTEELSVEDKARKELALRILTRKRLLPFVERFNADYQAGWVHKDICRRLEQFSRDVVAK